MASKRATAFSAVVLRGFVRNALMASTGRTAYHVVAHHKSKRNALMASKDHTAFHVVEHQRLPFDATTITNLNVLSVEQHLQSDVIMDV